MSEVTITILATNDIHGRFLPESGVIDPALLAAYRESLGPDCLLVDAGDPTQGTPLAIRRKGLDPIDILNAMGCRIMTIGNHEFDNITKDPGQENELDRIVRQFEGKILSVNVLKETGAGLQNYLESLGQENGRWLVQKVGGVELLFLGLSTPAMSTAIPRMQGFKIAGTGDDEPGGKNMYQLTKEAIAEAKAKHPGIGAVIALAHLGDMESAANSENLAKNVPELDLIIDGHSHQKYANKVGNTAIIQSECYGRYIGRITLIFKDGRLVRPIRMEHLAPDGLPRLPRQQKTADLLEALKGEMETSFGRLCSVASNTSLWGGALDPEKPFFLKALNVSRYVQTNLGQLAGEAIVALLREKAVGLFQADEYLIGTINGGAVREGLGPGRALSYSDLYNVFPSHLDSENESGLAVFRLTLAQLKDVLTNSVSKLDFSDGLIKVTDGRFLNTSGLKYVIRKNEARAAGSGEQPFLPGDRITLTSAVDPLLPPLSLSLSGDSDRTVLIGVTKYLAGGGDGYDKLKDLPPVLRLRTPLYQIVGDYIRDRTEDGRFYYRAVGDDAAYEGFTFKAPPVMTIRLTDQEGKSLSRRNLALSFRGPDGFGPRLFKRSDAQGHITAQIPEGPSVLSLMAFNSYGDPEGRDNLYGELFFHSYFSLPQTPGTPVTARLAPKNDVIFTRYDLTAFRHTSLSTGRSHYSNFISHKNWDKQHLSGLCYDQRLYLGSAQGDGEINFQPVERLDYLDAAGNKKSLSVPLPESFDYLTGGDSRYTGQPLPRPRPRHLPVRLPALGYSGQTQEFDDWAAAERNGLNLTKIVIYSGQILDGLMTFYGRESVFHGGRPDHSGDPYGGRATEIVLEPGDPIVAVTGRLDRSSAHRFNSFYQVRLRLKSGRVHGPFGWLGEAATDAKFELSWPRCRLVAWLGAQHQPGNWPKPVISRLGACFMEMD